MVNTVLIDYNDKLAPLYDEATAGKGAWRAPEETVKLVVPFAVPGCDVLDLGVGTGHVAIAMRDYGCHVTGVDISMRMLEIARKKLPKSQLLHGDIAQPLRLTKPQHFDIILASGVLEFVKDADAVMRNINSHLRNGGIVCMAYEELIPGSRVQGSPFSPRGAGFYTEIPRELSFLVYRRTLPEMRTLLGNIGLEIVRSTIFEAYRLQRRNSRESEPVIYRAILACRSLHKRH